MPLFPEDPASSRQETINRIANYSRQGPRRLFTYLFPTIWLLSSVVRYAAIHDLWNLFLLIFWSIALLGVIVFEYSRRKRNLRDMATLDEFRRRQGADISFGEENLANASENIRNLKDRGGFEKLKPLFAFVIFLAAVFSVPLVFHYIKVLFSK